MNLKNIRDAMYAQADWGPKTSPAADARMNKFINRAYNIISLEAPFLFFEEVLRQATEPDVTPSTTDTVQFVANPSPIETPSSWVIEQTNFATAETTWPADRSWDGRVIEIKDANGHWHRNIIRTIFTAPGEEAVQATATLQVVSGGQGSSTTQTGDRLEFSYAPIPGIVTLHCVDASPPGIPQVTTEFNNAATISGVATNIVGSGVAGLGGVNDPFWWNVGPNPPTITGATTATSGQVILTAGPVGAAGNDVAAEFDPFGAGGAITLASASSPVPGAGPVNFAGGKDAVEQKPPKMSLWFPFDTDTPPPGIVPAQEGVIGPGPFQYRIYTKEYHIPDDIIQLNSVRLWKRNNSWPLDVLGQEDAERQNIVNMHPDLAKGIPRVMFRGTHFQMMAPAEAPAVEPVPGIADLDNGDWEGPEPAGEFEYRITYCWGARDPFVALNPGPFSTVGKYRTPLSGLPLADIGVGTVEEGDTQAITQWGPQRIREPRWESAPSEASASIVVKNSGAAVLMTFANIEYMLGFFTGYHEPVFPPALEPARNFMSGWYIRIYRRRKKSDFTNYVLRDRSAAGIISPNPGALNSGLKSISSDEPFYLLSEFHIDSTNSGQFVDNGTIIPDRNRRLRDTHGYQSIHLYPVPNDRYELELRCIRRPIELKNSNDVPQIHAEACDLLVGRSLQLLYESEGNIPMMSLAKGRYERQLMNLSKRYGDLRMPQVPVLKRLSRASPGYRARIRYRQWWNTATD